MTAIARSCKRCDALIPPERVEAIPDTELCVACSQSVGSEWQYSFSRESTGKAGSLKKNYGGVNIRKRRREITHL